MIDNQGFILIFHLDCCVVNCIHVLVDDAAIFRFIDYLGLLIILFIMYLFDLINSFSIQIILQTTN